MIVPDARLFDLATRSTAFASFFDACDNAAMAGEMGPLLSALGHCLLRTDVPSLVAEALRMLSQSDGWSPQHGGPGQLPLYRSGTLSVGLMRLDPAEVADFALRSSSNEMLVGSAGIAAIEVIAQAVDEQREALVGKRWETLIRPGQVMWIPAGTLATSLSVSVPTVVMLVLRSYPRVVARTFSLEGNLLERDVVHRDLSRARYLLNVLQHAGEARDIPAVLDAVSTLSYPLEAELSDCLRSLAEREEESACR
jgi:hypothetical protein